MSITCPNCHYLLEVRVAAKPPKAPHRQGDVTPITDVVLADVFNWMKTRGYGEGSTAALYHDYMLWTKLPKPPTKQGFAISLGRNGATRWRTAQAHGYTIPAIPKDARPATMSPEQRERFEAAHQRQGVAEHRGGGRQETAKPKPDYSDLPFEIDLEDQSYTPGGEVDPTAGEPDDVQARIDAGLPPF